MSCFIGIRIIVWIYLLNITVVVVRGQSGGPNAVVAINGKTTLDCNTNSLAGSNWLRTSDGTSDALPIAYGCSPVTGGNATYYRTEVIGGNVCRLTIANVTMQQAGVYSCFDGFATTYRSLVTIIDPAARVVVYNRSEVVDGDQLNISCSIDYNGPASPAPSLHPLPYWTTSSPEQIFTNATYHPSTKVVTVVATITVQKPTVPVFQCRTVFEITGSNINYNLTAPADDLTVGNTKQLDVQYAVSIPVITIEPQVITINDVSCGISVLTCSNSTGNPAPSYRWFDSAENVVLTTASTLTLAEINRNYKCEVFNIIRNVEHNASATFAVTEGNCASIVQCCVFPRDETTSVTVNGCDNGTSCDCSKSYGGITLTCNAKTFPNSSYIWEVPTQNAIYSPVYEVTLNGMHRCTAYFNEALTNYTGDVKFSNGTNETDVQECSNPVTSTTLITHLTSTTTPDDTTCNNTACPDPHKTDVGVIVGIVIGVIVILNGVATGLFFWYYKRVEVSHSGKIERNNKVRLDRRFPWLKKMMPCVSDTKESAGSNCLWVSLFILLGIVTGIVTFPIWILLANKYENNETSALTLNKSENGERNGSGENGRAPTNISSANHSQPPPTNQMNAFRREDPYQNESREHIEMNNSLRSRNLLLSDSPPSKPPPAGRPPPPPNKPTMNSSSTSRSKDYAVNDQQTQAANPENTTYADLPFVPRNTLPTATPVQFLNVSNDTYASLNKT